MPRRIIELTAEYAAARDEVQEIVFGGDTAETQSEYVRRVNLGLKRVEQRLYDINQKYVATLPKPKRIKDGAFKDIRNSFAAKLSDMRRGTYMELNTGVKTATGAIKTEINKAFRKLNKSDNHLGKYLDIIKSAFEKRDILTVEYQNGACIKLGNYAAMLARTSRIETDNVNGFMNALEDGTDLVQCIGQSPTCELCAIYRGRVFSITGKSKDYPPLYDGENSPLRGDYNAIHPNCRCQFIPYYPELETKEQIEKDKARSNEPFTDNRTKKERDEYAEWQSINRKRWKEQSEYEAMQRVYGDDIPYKTLGSFRRAYRSEQGSTAYEITHKVRADIREYERYVAVLGKDNMPDTLAKFREMKYNESVVERRRFDLLRQFKESVAADKVDNIGFEEYERITREAHERLVGITTSMGVKVEAISQHLVDRIIGCAVKKRKGVPICDVIDTLANGKCDNNIRIAEDGTRSVGFIKDNNYVSFNLDTKKVIQCRPASKKERKLYAQA